jgi:hypothetical protein
VSTKLAGVASELSRSVEDVNHLAAASLGDTETPLGAVVRPKRDRARVRMRCAAPRAAVCTAPGPAGRRPLSRFGCERVGLLRAASPACAPPRLCPQVRILNGQLQALSQLEARVDELAGDVARVSGGGRAA